MRRMEKYILAVAVLAFASCVRESQYESDMDSVNGRISSVEEQSAGIRATIDALTIESESLEKYVETLQYQSKQLEDTYASLQRQIDAQRQITGDVDTEVRNFMENLNSRLDAIDDDIIALREMDNSLRNRIAELERITGGYATKDWVAATFMSLAQKDSVGRLIAAVAVKTESVEKKVAGIAVSCRANAAAIHDLDSSTRAEIEKLYVALDTVKAQVTRAYEKEIPGAVAASEKILKEWVGGMLNGYYDMAEVDAKIGDLNEKVEDLRAELDTMDWNSEIYRLDSLFREDTAAVGANTRAVAEAKIKMDENRTVVSELETFLVTFEKNYKDADSVMREDFARTEANLRKEFADADTALHGEFERKLKAFSDTLDEKVDVLQEQVDVLTGRMDDVAAGISELQGFVISLSSEVDKLTSRIQSIEVVPMYGDGSIDVATGMNEIWFDVRPQSFADSLVKAFGSSPAGHVTLSLTGRNARPATKAGVSARNVAINKLKFENGFVGIEFDGSRMPSDFFTGAGKYQGCLTVKTTDDITGTQQSTEYFAMEPIVTSNCFINTGAQTKTFKAVRGNSNVSTGEIAKVEVLWESFGTDVTPSVGDIVSSVSYSNGYITYTTTANKGNAVIAAKNSDGTILWSWHIWCTDQPAEQDYNNGAGTMMDRNLGATETTVKSVGALGLMYQWGRKDPFLGAATMTPGTQVRAASTLPLESWNKAEVKDNSTDKDINLMFSIHNPTTFIYITSVCTTGDWYGRYGAHYNQNDTLWLDSGGKTMYDPCPEGWRVPDGGIWKKAFGVEDSFKDSLKFDKGYDFQSTTPSLVNSGICWYPAAGYVEDLEDSHATPSSVSNQLTDVTTGGYYWTSEVLLGDSKYSAFLLYLSRPAVYTYISADRARGRSVRCMKEK